MSGVRVQGLGWVVYVGVIITYRDNGVLFKKPEANCTRRASSTKITQKLTICGFRRGVPRTYMQ